VAQTEEEKRRNSYPGRENKQQGHKYRFVCVANYNNKK
jgi:hypothetical protein